jgi:hypothetical protein
MIGPAPMVAPVFLVHYLVMQIKQVVVRGTAGPHYHLLPHASGVVSSFYLRPQLVPDKSKEGIACAAPI